MQKEDIQWAVLGILILLVIAFVIKPMATGQPVNIGLPTPTPTPTPSPAITEVATIGIQITATTEIPTATPTPVPTWNQQAQTVEFVDPSVYGLNLNQSIPNGTKITSSGAAFRNDTLTTYATFSGQYSGTTQVLNIPFPYWELWYTADPWTTDIAQQGEVSGRYVITPTTGVVESGFSGSFSTAVPVLSIQVMDADDPNRIVRTITPPGGMNPIIWTGDDDPRPWKEKFYEGQKKYYFVVQSAILKSYSIEIKVPASYIGKY
jgi:hypothetical protein